MTNINIIYQSGCNKYITSDVTKYVSCLDLSNVTYYYVHEQDHDLSTQKDKIKKYFEFCKYRSINGTYENIIASKKSKKSKLPSCYGGAKIAKSKVAFDNTQMNNIISDIMRHFDVPSQNHEITLPNKKSKGRRRVYSTDDSEDEYLSMRASSKKKINKKINKKIENKSHKEFQYGIAVLEEQTNNKTDLSFLTNLTSLFEVSDLKTTSILIGLLDKLKKSNRFNNIKSDIYDTIFKKNIDIEDKIRLVNQLHRVFDISKFGDELIKGMFIYKMNNYDFNQLFDCLLKNDAQIPKDIYNVFPVDNCQLLDVIHAKKPIQNLPDIFIARLCKYKIDAFAMVYDRYLSHLPINQVLHSSLCYDLYHLLSDNEMCYLLEIMNMFEYNFEDVKSEHFFPHIYFAFKNNLINSSAYLINKIHNDFNFLNNIFIVNRTSQSSKYTHEPIIYNIFQISNSILNITDMNEDMNDTMDETMDDIMDDTMDEEELDPIFEECRNYIDFNKNRYKINMRNNKIVMLINNNYDEILGVFEPTNKTIHDCISKDIIGKIVGNKIVLDCVLNGKHKGNNMIKQLLTKERIKECDAISCTSFTKISVSSSLEIFKYSMENEYINIDDLIFRIPTSGLDIKLLDCIINHIIVHLQDNPENIEKLKGHVFDFIDFDGDTQDIITSYFITSCFFRPNVNTYVSNLKLLFNMIKPKFTESYLYNLMIMIRTVQHDISSAVPDARETYATKVLEIINLIMSQEIIMTDTAPVLCIASSLVRYSLNTSLSIKVDIPIDLLTKCIEMGFSKAVKSKGDDYLLSLGNDYRHLVEAPVENIYINDKCSICLDRVDKLCYSDKCGHAVVCLDCYIKSNKSKCVMCKEPYGNLKFVRLLY
jgi:hypothetical protein